MLDTGRLRAASAVASGAVLPAMPMWLGTQTKVMLCSKFICECKRSRISTIRGFCRFLFSMALGRERKTEHVQVSRPCCFEY